MIHERKMIVAMPMGTSVGKENEINQNKKNGRKRKKRRMEVAVVLEGLFLENGECGFSGL